MKERKTGRERDREEDRKGLRKIRKNLKWRAAVKRYFSHFTHSHCVYMKPECVVWVIVWFSFLWPLLHCPKCYTSMWVVKIKTKSKLIESILQLKNTKINKPSSLYFSRSFSVVVTELCQVYVPFTWPLLWDSWPGLEGTDGQGDRVKISSWVGGILAYLLQSDQLYTGKHTCGYYTTSPSESLT